MIKFVAVIGFACCLPVNSAVADEASNIAACAQVIEARTGEAPNRFNVVYQGNFLAMSVAEWPGIQCEVKLETVYNLTVNGTQLVFEGWPSLDAKQAFDKLKQENLKAQAMLASRQSILADELSKAEEKLMTDGTSISQITKSHLDLIGQALGH